MAIDTKGDGCFNEETLKCNQAGSGKVLSKFRSCSEWIDVEN